MDREELTQNIIENMAKCHRPGLNNAWRDIGLSHAQVGVLYLLYYHQGASVKQAADYLGISKSAMTQLADPLADKGFLKRSQDQSDRRVVRMELTAEGRQALKGLAKHKFAGLRSALSTLDDNELKELSRLYKKMASQA